MKKLKIRNNKDKKIQKKLKNIEEQKMINKVGCNGFKIKTGIISQIARCRGYFGILIIKRIFVILHLRNCSVNIF